MSKNVYLRQNVVAEPLFNQWYAWSYLIAPATAAMYMSNSHLKIMQSFVSAPQTHIAALKNPAMMGGPFINYPASATAEIKGLMERTSKEHTDLLKLSEAIPRLDEVLAQEAAGFSLEPTYEKVPEPLKGYIELVYDLNNHPSIRFMEGLLYKSAYYKESAQSLSLSVIDNDDRPFVFSTPSLSSDKRMHLSTAFKSEKLDELFKMKTSPQSIGHITEMLGIGPGEAELFSSFFTNDAPPPRQDYSEDGIRIRYFGHACILIEAKGVSILCDPVISYKFDSPIDRYTYADLPETIDFALVTHNHQDHCMFETLLQLRHKIKNLVVPRSRGGSLSDPSLKLILQTIGFKNVIEIEEMEEIAVEGGGIMGLPFLGEHADLDIRTKAAYLIRLHGRSILCAADSNNIEPLTYKHIHDLTGDVDVLFLGMECAGAPLSWLYGPLLTKPLVRKMDQTRRLDGSDSQKALRIVDQLNARQVYVYAMGMEPWLTYVTSIAYTAESRPMVESNKFLEACRSRGLESERPFGKKEIFLAAR